MMNQEMIILEKNHALLFGLFLCFLFTAVGWLSSSITPLLFQYLSRKKREKVLPLQKKVELLESQVRLQSEKITEIQNTLNSVFLSTKRR